MAKKCIHCGQDNDDSRLQCVCGRDLQEAAAIESVIKATTESVSRVRSPTDGRRLVVRKILFVLWAIAFVPLFALLRSRLQVSPLQRSLIGTGVFFLPAVAALWFLGREKQRTLRAWRIFFLAWALLLSPLLLDIVYGIAEQGWPTGRYNRPIARVLLLVLMVTIPAFLTCFCGLLRTYRVAGMLALVTGLTSLGTSVFLFQATKPIKIWPHHFADVLDIIGFGAKLVTYLAIPIGIAFVIGGIMTFRAARRRAVAPRLPGGSAAVARDFRQSSI